MNTQPTAAQPQSASFGYELRFSSLFNPGRGFVVPCDAAGQVDMAALPRRLRSAYLGARESVGREYCFPTVQRLH